MLDDLKYIHQKDVQDVLGIAARQGAQLLHDFKLPARQFGDVANIVYAGMGGSALPAEVLKSWLALPKPLELLRGYDIPAYVDAHTLFIASSYSGNTEETLSALAQAENKGAQIAVIASGGKLQQLAQEKGHLFALIPKAEQPRYAVLSNVKASLDILAMAGVIEPDAYQQQLHAAAQFLQESVKAWDATVPTRDNPAKQLAQELIGKSVVVYGGPKMYAAAYKWKISFNENAKQVAWVGQLPEFNHNEFIGWSEQPVQKPYAVIDLRSNLEHPRVQKRFEVSARLLSGMRPEPFVVQAQGKTQLEELLWMIAFGDFTSTYVAILNGLNPAPVDLVEKFKKALDE